MRNFLRDWWFAILLIAIYFIASNILVLNRFWQFEAYYYDHGIFDSALWEVAHFQIPLIDHLELNLIRHMGDHFTPAFYLLSPVYWFTSSYEPILIIQNFLIATSAFILLLIAKTRLTSKIMVFALIFAFLFFIGLQNFLIANLHSESVAILAIAITLWSLLRKNYRLYWVGILLILGTKENFATIVMGLGIYAFFTNKKLGVATILAAIGYLLTVTLIVIPLIGQHRYMYGISLPNLTDILRLFFSPSMKIETLVTSLLTFGGLPLLGLPFLPAIFQDFFGRFVLASSATWDLGLHYSATSAILLAYGAILGATFLEKSKLYKKIEFLHAILIIFLVLFFHRFIYHGPFGLLTNSAFYQQTDGHTFLREFVAAIPKSKTVMTHNNIAPYLTHTNGVLLLRGDYKKWNPEIIALDLRPGQNPNDFWPMNEAAVKDLDLRISTDSGYLKLYQKAEQKIYVRDVK